MVRWNRARQEKSAASPAPVSQEFWDGGTDNAGLANRERLQNDQKRISFNLTLKSHVLASAMATEIEEIYAMIEKHVGKEKIERFYKILDELIMLMTDISSNYDKSSPSYQWK